MGKVFLFDAAKCNGCRNCQLACKDEHVDNEWAPWAKPQPDTGHFWCRIDERVRGQVPKVKVAYVAHRCQHCGDAPCMAAAPEAVYRRPDGLVIVDPEKAHGLRELVEACPDPGAVYYNEKRPGHPPEVHGLRASGGRGRTAPYCVDVCPHEALRFGDEEDFAEEIAAAEARNARTRRGRPAPHLLPEPAEALPGRRGGGPGGRRGGGRREGDRRGPEVGRGHGLRGRRVRRLLVPPGSRHRLARVRGGRSD